MMSHEELVQEWMQDRAFARAYVALEHEFALFDERLRACKEAGRSPAGVAVSDDGVASGWAKRGSIGHHDELKGEAEAPFREPIDERRS